MKEICREKHGTNLHWYFYIVALVILLPLFFWGGPDGHASRSFKAFWDLGHILFFMLFVLVLAGRGAKNNFSWSWAGKMLFWVLGCGVFIEVLQAGLGGRSSGLGDVWRDLGGGMIGIVWVGWGSVSRMQRGLFVLAILSVGVISAMPLGGALFDEVRIRRVFPLLSGFETSGELSRWQAETEIVRVENPVREGRFALRLPLTTDMYSGIGLKYFFRNWQGMKGLSLSIYNPEQSELRLTFRVHDRQHVEGEQVYADRFNRSLTMQPGWNDVFISMDDIKNAPVGREMDLGSIYGFGLFASGLEEERVVYVDEVRLVSLTEAQRAQRKDVL